MNECDFFKIFIPTIKRKMPYRIRKAPRRDLYWVVGPDGKHHSKEPIPRERAEAQMRALYASERQQKLKGGETPADPFDPSFAQQEYEKSKTAIQTGLQQLTPEQVEKNIGYVKELAPQKFVTADAPTRAKYQRYSDASKARGLTPLSFDEWSATQSKRELSRQADYQDVSQRKRGALENLGERVAQREEVARVATEEEARDPTVVCPYDKDGNRQNIRDLVKKSECARRYDQFQYKENPTLYQANKYFFKPVVSGLTKVADFAVENLAPVLPGVGQVAAEVYKNFAPPGSQYHNQNLLEGQGQFHYVKVRGSGTHRENVLKRLGLEDKSYSLKELSKASSVPMNILRQVYNRGIGAFKTQPSSVRLKGSYVKNVDAPMSKKLSKEEWAYARVYSFLDGNPKHDEDLRANKGLKGGGPFHDELERIATRVSGEIQTYDLIQMAFEDKDASDFSRTFMRLWDELTAHHDDRDVKRAILDRAPDEFRDALRRDRATRTQQFALQEAAIDAERKKMIEKPDTPEEAAERAYRRADRRAELQRQLDEEKRKPKKGPQKLPIRGGSWWMTAFNKAKELAKSAVQRVKDVAKGVRTDNYPPRVRETIASIGDQPIIQIQVRRDPIKGMLHTLLNAITLGKWEAMRKKYAFDKVFHLGLELTVRLSPQNESVGRYVLEKNETINIGLASAPTKDTEFWNVPMKGSTTLNELLDGAKKMLGPAYFTYDAFSNNCQDFIMAILQGSGLASPTLTAVVKQQLDEALRTELPGYTAKVARFATDVAAVANVALEGRGGPKASFGAQLKEFGVEPKLYLRRAQRVAQMFGYPHKQLTWSDRADKKLMIVSPEGKKVHFGQVKYGDYLLYTLSGQKKLGDEKRRNYLARATKIKGKWHSDKYSPNNLAINILWAPKSA